MKSMLIQPNHKLNSASSGGIPGKPKNSLLQLLLQTGQKMEHLIIWYEFHKLIKNSSSLKKGNYEREGVWISDLN